MFLYVRALLLILGISFAAQDDNENMVLQRVSSLVLWYFLEVFSFLSYGFQNLQKGFLFAEEIVVLKTEWRKSENW